MKTQQYLVSARKYRPTRFDEVVGQEVIVKTLKNAIKTDQLGQAFLFTGPRGIGTVSYTHLDVYKRQQNIRSSKLLSRQ